MTIRKILSAILGIGSFVLMRLVWQWRKTGDIGKLSAIVLSLVLFIFGLASFYVAAPESITRAAEGDYISYWSTSGSYGPLGITTDGTNIWVSIGDDTVQKYDMTGSYVNYWSLTADNADPLDITTNGTNIWVVDTVDGKIYKYNMSGSYVSSWSLNSANDDPKGITTDGTYIWVTDNNDDEVYKYNMSGSYSGSHFDTYASGNNYPYGMATDGTYIWITDWVVDKVYKYNVSGTYINYWDLTADNDTSRGITTDDTDYFWVTDYSGKKVYKYDFGGGTPPPARRIIDIQ